MTVFVSDAVAFPAQVVSLSSSESVLPAGSNRSGRYPLPRSPVKAVPCTADRDPYDRVPPCWSAPGQYDYTHLDRLMNRVLEADGDTYLIASITTCSPDWWDERHPDELMQWGEGVTLRELGGGCAKKAVPSLGSELWQETMTRNVGELVRHIEAASYADRVVGYTISFGAMDSWTYFGTHEGYPFDYNHAMTRRFQAWLRERYGNDARLSEAWAQKATLNEAKPPAPEEMALVAPTGFRDPGTQHRHIDYGLFLAHVVAETIGALAGAMKSACSGRALVGLRYGHFMDLLQIQNGLQQSGQLGLAHVLENRHIDFLIAAAGTDPSDPGIDGCFSTAPETSIRKHGKVLFHALDPDGAGREASAFVKRQGLGIWLEGGRDRADCISMGTTEIEDSSGAEDSPGNYPPSGAVEKKIALVLDDMSMFYIQRLPNQLDALIAGQARELCKARLPFDTILLGDLGEDSDYSFLIFPNLFFADHERRKAIRLLLKRNRATALWLVAPGFVDEEALFENIQNLTGIKIHKPDREHQAVITCTGRGEKISYGLPGMCAHTPIIMDPDCEVLGLYAKSKLPGLGVKVQDGWRSIYSGAPRVSAGLLRRFALDAGALIEEGEER